MFEISQMYAKNKEIIKVLKDGEKDSIIKIFRTYYSGLYHYAAKIVDSFEIAKEIVQDIFVDLWINRNRIEINTSVKSYLFKAVRNDCLDYLKHKKIEKRYISAHINLIQKENFSNNSSLAEKEITEIIKSSISSLPRECRKVFVLSRFNDLKNKEIAQSLGISIKTVESQIGKALKILRKNLKDYL